MTVSALRAVLADTTLPGDAQVQVIDELGGEGHAAAKAYVVRQIIADFPTAFVIAAERPTFADASELADCDAPITDPVADAERLISVWSSLGTNPHPVAVLCALVARLKRARDVAPTLPTPTPRLDSSVQGLVESVEPPSECDGAPGDDEIRSAKALLEAAGYCVVGPSSQGCSLRGYDGPTNSAPTIQLRPKPNAPGWPVRPPLDARAAGTKLHEL